MAVNDHCIGAALPDKNRMGRIESDFFHSVHNTLENRRLDRKNAVERSLRQKHFGRELFLTCIHSDTSIVVIRSFLPRRLVLSASRLY